MNQSPVSCADAVGFIPGGLVVIIRRLTVPLGLALPGGKCEPGESPEETAVREFHEETGLTLRVCGRVGHYGAPGRDPRGPFETTVCFGDAYGSPRHEPGKTEVLLLCRMEIERRSHEFVLDHAKIIGDFFDLIE